MPKCKKCGETWYWMHQCKETEKPEFPVDNIVSQPNKLRELLLAVEFGYLQNERGHNLQQTLDEFVKAYAT